VVKKARDREPVYDILVYQWSSLKIKSAFSV